MARTSASVEWGPFHYFNARRGRSGHPWQARFFSCPLGPAHLWTALRYVELNPVRAGLVTLAEEYEWSSASAHLAGQDRSRLLDMEFWRREGGLANWRELLGRPCDENECRALRRATHAGQPSGDEAIYAADPGAPPPAGARRGRIWGGRLPTHLRQRSIMSTMAGRLRSGTLLEGNWIVVL